MKPVNRTKPLTGKPSFTHVAIINDFLTTPYIARLVHRSYAVPECNIAPQENGSVITSKSGSTMQLGTDAFIVSSTASKITWCIQTSSPTTSITRHEIGPHGQCNAMYKEPHRSLPTWMIGDKST